MRIGGGLEGLEWRAPMCSYSGIYRTYHTFTISPLFALKKPFSTSSVCWFEFEHTQRLIDLFGIYTTPSNLPCKQSSFATWHRSVAFISRCLCPCGRVIQSNIHNQRQSLGGIFSIPKAIFTNLRGSSTLTLKWTAQTIFGLNIGRLFCASRIAPCYVKRKRDSCHLLLSCFLHLQTILAARHKVWHVHDGTTRTRLVKIPVKQCLGMQRTDMVLGVPPKPKTPYSSSYPIVPLHLCVLTIEEGAISHSKPGQ